VHLLPRHNHSHHLPRTRRSPTITACSLHHPDGVSHRRPDQNSNHTGASRPLIGTCTAEVLRGHLRDTATAQGHPPAHTAITAPLTRVARRSRRLRSPTNPWSSKAKANAPTQALHTMRTHEITDRTTTYLPVRIASQMDPASQSRVRVTCMIRLGRGVPTMAHQRSGGGRWGNHIIPGQVLPSSSVACRLLRIEIVPRRCSPSLIPSSVHRANTAGRWDPILLRVQPGVSQYPKSRHESRPRLDGRSQLRYIEATAATLRHLRVLRRMVVLGLKTWFAGGVLIT
jgi:hypothetical protein